METAGAVLVTLGFGAMVIFAGPFSAWSLRSQSKTWGFRFDPRTERMMVPFVRLLGALGVAWGIFYLVTTRG